jgi:hypothetical protein
MSTAELDFEEAAEPGLEVEAEWRSLAPESELILRIGSGSGAAFGSGSGSSGGAVAGNLKRPKRPKEVFPAVGFGSICKFSVCVYYSVKHVKSGNKIFQLNDNDRNGTPGPIGAMYLFHCQLETFPVT